MELDLTFAKGKVTGTGIDDVGKFVIKGLYDTTTLECWWTKTYPGSHDVFYRGFREGKGIWGMWEITAFTHGGFLIWPRAIDESEPAEEKAGQAHLSEFVPGITQLRAERPQF